jgi:hypothetical protein
VLLHVGAQVGRDVGEVGHRLADLVVQLDDTGRQALPVPLPAADLLALLPLILPAQFLDGPRFGQLALEQVDDSP